MEVRKRAPAIWNYGIGKHKTDAIFRVENMDRYDDRDVIITNLLDTYDRLIAFGQKHLSDPFVQEGVQSVSARDRILREICSSGILISTPNSTLVEPRNLLRAMYSAQLFPWPRLPWKRWDRRKRPKLQPKSQPKYSLFFKISTTVEALQR